MKQENLHQALDPFVREFKALHGANLRCLALYGSAVEGNFIPGKSNLNTIAVFGNLDFDVLKRSLSAAGKASRKGILAPVMTTEPLMKASADVFPVEYLGLRECHEVLHGEDLLKGLVIKPEDLRRECEEMIKGLLVRLRSAYLESGGRPKALEALLLQAVPALMPVFRSLAFIRGGGYPAQYEAAVFQAGTGLGFDDHLLSQLLEIRRGNKPALGCEIVLAHLLDELAAMAEAVDKGEKIQRR